MDWLDRITLGLALLAVVLALRHPLHEQYKKTKDQKKAAPKSGLPEHDTRSD